MNALNPKYQAPNVVPTGQVKTGQDYYDEQADAVDRDEYYGGLGSDFDQATSKELFQKLSKLVGSTHVPQTSYGEARKHLYSWVDRRPDGNLYNLYDGYGPKNEDHVKNPTPVTLENYNCEHVVPQAWAKHKKPMKTDLHHLFTEDIERNAIRGNNALREITTGPVPDEGLLDEEGNQFQPKGGKGEIARAVMYYVTRYPEDIGNQTHEYQTADLDQLLQWHRDYPVSDYERHRNDAIQDIQGNRNPFIDFPELAEKVDLAEGFSKP